MPYRLQASPCGSSGCPDVPRILSQSAVTAPYTHPPSTAGCLPSILPEKQLWSYRSGGEPAGASAVAADGTVYLATLDGRLSAVSHRGFTRWRIETGAGIAGSPVIDSGEAVYISDGSGGIRAYTPWGGELWSLGNSAGSRGGDKWCAAVDSHILYSAYGRHLSAVSSGEVLWSRETPAAVTGIVVAGGEFLLCSLADGRAFAVDFNGDPLWTAEGGGYSSWPVAGVSRVFLVRDGALVSIGPDGAVEGIGRVESTVLTQPVMGGGLLVCGSEQWVACAFNVSDNPGAGWSQQGGGPAHSGTAGLSRWHFNEEEYLRNMDYLYLRRLILDGSADEKLDAVGEIGERIAADGIDRGERYLLHLLHIALTEGSIRFTANAPVAAADFPAVRREAARLTGEYGNFESIELLTAVLAEERHYDVSAAIITALGRLGADYNGLVEITIYNKVIKDNNINAHDALGLAAAGAVEQMAAYSGVPRTGYGYRTLMTINRGNYSAGVRRRAGEVLKSLRSIRK